MRLPLSFFRRDTVTVARELIGKRLIRVFDDGSVFSARITEVEAYCGIEDLACHASKGRTPRTEVMFAAGGLVYVYFIYGMYWMLNFVTGKKDEAGAVLIRGVEGIDGPGRLGRTLKLDRSFYSEDMQSSSRLWVENDKPLDFVATPRIGIQSAGEPWVSKNWRFILKDT